MKYFLSQQAIFNKSLEVIGYGLCFESGFDQVVKTESAPHGEDTPSIEYAIAKLFFSIGIDPQTAKKKAFIPFSKKLIMDHLATLFSTAQLGLIISIPDPFDETLFQECLKLKRQGYTIILENYRIREADTRFLEAGSMLRLNAEQIKDFKRDNLIPILKMGVELIANHIDTTDDLEFCRDLGFRFFQGTFYSRPQSIERIDIPGFKLLYLQLMREVLKPDIEFKKIEDIVIKDVSLSYKVLKMVNSAIFGFRKEITSIRQALVIIGAKEIKKWVSLVITNHLGEDKPDELFKKALFRARFCELLAPFVGLTSKSPDFFLMGMFSLIDAFVDQPMEVILQDLPLSENIKQALAGKNNAYYEVLSLVVEYEKGNWEFVIAEGKRLGIDDEKLTHLYFSSVEWAVQIFN